MKKDRYWPFCLFALLRFILLSACRSDVNDSSDNNSSTIHSIITAGAKNSIVASISSQLCQDEQGKSSFENHTDYIIPMVFSSTLPINRVLYNQLTPIVSPNHINVNRLIRTNGKANPNDPSPCFDTIILSEDSSFDNTLQYREITVKEYYTADSSVYSSLEEDDVVFSGYFKETYVQPRVTYYDLTAETDLGSFEELADRIERRFKKKYGSIDSPIVFSEIWIVDLNDEKYYFGTIRNVVDISPDEHLYPELFMPIIPYGESNYVYSMTFAFDTQTKDILLFGNSVRYVSKEPLNFDDSIFYSFVKPDREDLTLYECRCYSLQYDIDGNIIKSPVFDCDYSTLTEYYFNKESYFLFFDVNGDNLVDIVEYSDSYINVSWMYQIYPANE